MKITFLGTAAAEGLPAMYCACEKCKKARALGGKNIRTRSQAIIDDCLLIDYPADTYAHILANNIDLMNIKNCLITHNHSDHFYPRDFDYLMPGFSHPNEDYKLKVYGSIDIKDKIEDIAKNSKYLSFGLLNAFEPTVIDGYKVTPLKSFHGTPNPYFYAIEKDGKALLYAHDTDYFYDEVWDYLEQSGIKFDLVSLDCTEGNLPDIDYRGHMCLGRNIRCRETMLNKGIADKNTVFIMNHFSHNGNDTVYEDIKIIAENNGFTATYDGMTVEF